MSIINLRLTEPIYSKDDISYDYNDFVRLLNFFAAYEERMIEEMDIKNSYFVTMIEDTEIECSPKLIDYIIHTCRSDSSGKLSDEYQKKFAFENMETLEDFISYLEKNRELLKQYGTTYYSFVIT